MSNSELRFCQRSGRSRVVIQVQGSVEITTLSRRSTPNSAGKLSAAKFVPMQLIVRRCFIHTIDLKT